MRFRTFNTLSVGTLRRAWHAVARCRAVLREADAQRACIETELYANTYRHVSKFDDDLPVLLCGKIGKDHVS